MDNSSGMGSSSSSSRMSNSMVNRIIGIVTFKAPVYKEVAEDPKATQEAIMIAVAMAILTGILSGLILPAGRGFLGAFIVSVVNTLIFWVIGAFLLAWVAKQFFQGKTDFNEMLRVTGYIC